MQGALVPHKANFAAFVESEIILLDVVVDRHVARNGNRCLCSLAPGNNFIKRHFNRYFVNNNMIFHIAYA